MWGGESHQHRADVGLEHVVLIPGGGRGAGEGKGRAGDSPGLKKKNCSSKGKLFTAINKLPDVP